MEKSSCEDVTVNSHKFRHCALSILATVSLVLGGCAVQTADVGVNTAKVQLLWPVPPDQPRFVHEISLSSAADIVVESEEQRLRRMVAGGKGVSNEPVYHKPAAVAARGGRVYVADPSSKAIIVFDASRRKMFKFGHRKPNQLENPLALAIDGKGLVYVLDGRHKRVMVFDELGLFKFELGDPAAFTNPVGVAVRADGQRIYIVDRGDVENNDHKVVAYAPNGEELFRLGPRGDAEGKFNIPLAAAVGADGTLYVVDTGNFRVQAFDADGKYRFAFGGVGVELGNFSRARSIALDRDNNIYVSDSAFNNVQIFDAAGNLLMPLGRFSRESGPGNFALIAGIGVDETNRLYVIDHYFKKIDVFRRLTDAEGKKLLASQ